MTINQKFKKVLELQDQGIDRREIFKELGYQSIDALTKMMKKFSYRYDKEKGKYIQLDQTAYMDQGTAGGRKESDSNIQQAQVKSREEVAVTKTSKMDTIIDLKNDMLKGNVIGLAKHYDEIMALLTWYKAFEEQKPSESSHKPQVIEVINQGIQITIPKVESVKTSIRINKDVWSEFGQFAELHSEFIKGDLLAQALKEYMEKHKESSIR